MPVRRRAGPARRADPRAPRPSRSSDTRPRDRARCRAAGRASARGAEAWRRAPWCRRTRRRARPQRERRDQRCIHPAAAFAQRSAPGRRRDSPSSCASASAAAWNAISGTGSHGVPIEQSTTPPGKCRPAAGTRRAGRRGTAAERTHDGSADHASPETDRHRDELGEMAGSRSGEAGAHPRALLVVHLDQHLAGPVQRREHVAPVVRNEAARRLRQRPQPLPDRRAAVRPRPRRWRPRTATAPGCEASAALRSSGSAMSALFHASKRGTSPASISRNTVSTAAMRSSASGALASTTCNSRSASATSSSVERNASTSWCGNRRTNPTVSESNTVSPPGRRKRRTVGSRVENNWFSTSTPACVSRLSNVDFPAFVYPTSATVGEGRAGLRALRCVARVAASAARSRSSFCVRRSNRRRSTSSCVSPGPRVPMPAPCWLSSRPRPRRRGKR